MLTKSCSRKLQLTLIHEEASWSIHEAHMKLSSSRLDGTPWLKCRLSLQLISRRWRRSSIAIASNSNVQILNMTLCDMANSWSAWSRFSPPSPPYLHANYHYLDQPARCMLAVFDNESLWSTLRASLEQTWSKLRGPWSPKLTYTFYPFSWKCRILW